MTLLHLLSYLRQPLVGAFTGYITTDVAIRLLFHPLKPWRVFGIRVPLTPGVFPAKRHQFAEKVGAMVGSHLLTSQDVKRALETEEFRRELSGGMNEKMNRLFRLDLGTFESLFPVDFQGWVRDLVGRLRHSGMQELARYLKSPGFERELHDLLRQKGEELLSRDLHTLVSPEQFEALTRHLAETVRAFLHSPQVGATLGHFVDRKLEELLASEVTLGELLPEEVIDALTRQMEQELALSLANLVHDPQFRQLLSGKLKESFRGALGSFTGVSGFFAKMIDPEWLLSQFPDFSRRIEEEIAQWLQDDSTRQRLSQALRQSVNRFLDRPVVGLLESVPYRKVAALRRLARCKAVRTLRSPQLLDPIVARLEAGLDRVKDRTLGSLLSEVFSEDGAERLIVAISGDILSGVRSPQAQEALERAVADTVEELLFQRPIGPLSNLIPLSASAQLGEMVYQQLADLLVKELPPLVDTLNIQKIVEDKVNALDIRDMEGLLLDIMKESFMFLNLFSAALGFLIGVLNLVVPTWGGP